jgi:CheY-like chemotaxis protein
VKLHGSLDRGRIVFSTRDYRHALYTDLSYLTFVRAVLATTTVLYLGFSFTDAYLNQLRSEILAMVGAGAGRLPTAYAVVADATDDDVAHFREHEGIELLPYAAGASHEGFDRYLAAIAERTRPGAVLARATAGKAILWLDPDPPNNRFGREVLDQGAPDGRRPRVVEARTVDEALARLAAERFDLVISCWGHDKEERRGRRVAIAERLLAEVPPEHRAPVIVFSDPTFAAENRARALRLGAFELTTEWPALFHAIARALG